MKTTELTELRDEIFKLTGVAVAEFQFLEHVLTACLAFVWPEKSEQMLAEIASDNPIRRGETIGRMLSVLRKTIKVPVNFDQRLSDFLENRNALIHRTFREFARSGNAPSPTELENLKRHILNLINEAEQLRRIFYGFFSIIGKQLASREDLGVESEMFTFLAPYEKEFDSAFKSS
jgi:hypothetical protein